MSAHREFLVSVDTTNGHRLHRGGQAESGVVDLWIPNPQVASESRGAASGLSSTSEPPALLGPALSVASRRHKPARPQ
jgi:hypothetical protein